MEYFPENNGVRVTGCRDFNIAQTLMCGQVFRYAADTGGVYTVISADKAVKIKEADGAAFLYPCTIRDFKDIWLRYLDLDRDYGAVKQALIQNDGIMQKAAAHGGGIRLLNQDAAEMLFSFIISQRMHINRIRRVIDGLCAEYGVKKNTPFPHFAFPDTETLGALTEADFRKLGAGYRAGYMTNAARIVRDGGIDLNPPNDKPVSEIKKELLSVKGVGPKVADCVLLFGFGRREAFPVDTWVRRAVTELYFGGRQLSDNYIQEWAKEKFGGNAGYAQQYLFHYMRNG